MKRFLLFLYTLVLLNVDVAAQVVQPQPQAVNADVPPGYPSVLYVKRVPLGSGTPAVGVAEGYEQATYVRDGLYHVPGYLPYGPDAWSVEPRVVSLVCHQDVLSGKSVWECNGYSVNPGLGRGENILINPIFQK